MPRNRRTPSAGRCVPEMIGTGDDKRPQRDQAVAACACRSGVDSQKAGCRLCRSRLHQHDGKKRMPLDTADRVRLAWRNAFVRGDYTDEQMRRIKMRITSAWKTLVDPAGPPAHEDSSAMLLLQRQDRADGQGCRTRSRRGGREVHDDYLERCIDEMTDNGGMDEDDAEEAYRQLAWDEEFGSQRRQRRDAQDARRAGRRAAGIRLVRTQRRIGSAISSRSTGGMSRHSSGAIRSRCSRTTNNFRSASGKISGSMIRICAATWCWRRKARHRGSTRSLAG